MRYILPILFLCLAVMSCGSASSKIESVEAFSADLWNSGSLQERGHQANFIVENNLFIGYSKKQVIQILGVPNSEGKEKIRYNVDIGIEWLSGFPMLYQLEFTFNDDKVESMSIIN